MILPTGKQILPNGAIAHFDIKQGTPEWDEMRLGRITGSGVDALMSDPRSKAAKDAGELSDGATNYLLKRVSECYLGYTGDKLDLKQFEWGHANEPEARQYYEVSKGVLALEVGFVEMKPWVGVSPDSLVGDDGGLEIKCPYNNAVHLSYLEIQNQDDLQECEKGYYWQIQMCMFVTGRHWWDFVSYDPRMTGQYRFHCIRIDRNEAHIADLQARVERGAKFINEKLIKYA
jgi:hypothetical protein